MEENYESRPVLAFSVLYSDSRTEVDESVGYESLSRLGSASPGRWHSYGPG